MKEGIGSVDKDRIENAAVLYHRYPFCTENSERNPEGLHVVKTIFGHLVRKSRSQKRGEIEGGQSAERDKISRTERKE